AASMGNGGEIFILDMGEPVKIVDLARDLIRLSGLVPEQDIEIRFTGMRPGEKLFEELALADEQADKTAHARIYIGRLRPHDWEVINREIDELGRLAGSKDVGLIHAKLQEIVPEYEYGALVGSGEQKCLRTDTVHGEPVHNGNGHEHGMNGSSATPLVKPA